MKETLALLEKVRGHYLEGYRSALARFIEQYHPSGPEVLFELPRPERAYAFRLYRADMASNANGEPTIAEVNLETHLEFQPFSERCDMGLEITLRPVAWNGIAFSCEGKVADVSQLEQWCIKWLDVDEIGPTDEDGLLQAIHSFSPPQTWDDQFVFSVDFGSAPIEAVADLLQVLARVGVVSVELSSPSAVGETSH